MTISNMTLEQVLASHPDKSFLFVRPGGNWGDHLIYWGAECLADRLGLEWRTVRVEDFDPAEVGSKTCVYIHGGGGMNPWCSGRSAAAVRKAIQSNAPLVIQGPSTHDNSNNYSGSFFAPYHEMPIEKEVFLFARDEHTLGILKTHAPENFSIGLDHDTALHVGRSDFIQRADIQSDRYHLCVARKDNEAPEARMPFRAIQLDPAIFAKSFDHWLRIHAAAKSIATNRLHSAIAGAILGVPTTLYGGSYHKNRSVWEKSLKDRGVLWGDFSAKEPSTAGDLLDQVGDAFNKSWKVNQLRLWYYEVPRS